jgi:2,4-dienoyl-CoA reductase-like NADH-dependent reductase (Old Yellow Enzyme family)/thioredoxin reductase
MSHPFPNLFSPCRLGEMELKNRLIMSLYPTQYVTDGKVNERLLQFCRRRAAGGAALLVLEGGCLDFPTAWKGPMELRMDAPEYAAGLEALAQAVQGEGARAFMHLNYPAALPAAEGTPGAVQKKGKWSLPLVSGGSAAQIERVAERLAAGASTARALGYDGVEVQAGWGDLVAQFLSPLTNRRVDEYGGALENRARLLLDIVKGIKRSAGADFPVQVKLCVDELDTGGLALEQGKAVAKALEAAGADSILVTVGNKKTKRFALPAYALEPGVSVKYAAAVKEAVDIPVVAMGKINTPALAERVLAGAHADMIAMTRALITDPDLPDKARAGRVEEIRGCIYCLEDCADKGVPGLGRACVNNPFAGQEYRIKVMPAAKPRRVWVVGGGPAGMQAALTAAERGHEVRLFEKDGRFGGSFKLAPLPPFKAEAAEVLRWLEFKIEQSAVVVELNREIRPEEVAAAKPDIVIVATGSHPKVLSLPGADRENVYSAAEFTAGRGPAGGTVVVIGGGALGCETAEIAADRGASVTVVEMGERAMPRSKSLPRAELLARLKKKGVGVLTETSAAAIEAKAVVTVDAKGNESRLAADLVIYAVGNDAVRELYERLQGHAAETYLIGDAQEPGNVGHALRTALQTAAEI